MPPTRRAPLLAVAAVVWAAALSACAGHMTPRDIMVMAVRSFNDGIRWGKIDVSALHLAIADRKVLAERFERLEEELEIVDYEVRRIDVAPGGKAANVRVDMSWLLKRRGIVERTVLDQRWEETTGWFMVKQSRVKGVALPLFED